MFDRMSTACGPLILSAIVLSSAGIWAQTSPAPNSQPNPYPNVAQWGQLPAGRVWGNTSAIDVDAQGHIWVAANADHELYGTNRTPHHGARRVRRGVQELGSGLFASPHGIHVDAEGNVWVTDAPGPGVAGGTATSDKGQQVMKFSPDGKLLLALGKAGVMGTDTATFNQPADVAVAPNGDIFVADGHGNGGS